MNKKFFPTFIMLTFIVGLFGLMHIVGSNNVQYAMADTVESVAPDITINNEAPEFDDTDPGYVGPAESTASTSAAPTQEDDGSITWEATITDDNNDNYWLVICSDSGGASATDSATPPTCTGSTRWAFGSGASGNKVTTNSYTPDGDEWNDETDCLTSSCNWDAYVCDQIDGTPLCVATSDSGSGDTGTPFYVNHKPALTGYATYEVSAKTDATPEPGEYVAYKYTVFDRDGDAVNIYVCDSGGDTEPNDDCENTDSNPDVGTLCSTSYSGTTTGSGYTSYCDESGSVKYITSPQAHGTGAGENAYYIYAYDTHGGTKFYSSGDTVQAIDVEDVDPTVGAYTMGSDITLDPTSSVGKSFTVIIGDDNGTNDVTTIRADFFDSDGVSLTNGSCATLDENQCYTETDNGACAFTTGPSAANTTDTATCDFLLYFNAYADADWKAHVNVSDGVEITSGALSSAVEVFELQAINIVETAINYLNTEPGTDYTTAESVTVQNKGNTRFDLLLDGDAMCDTSYTADCSAPRIETSWQKWHHSTNNFDWYDSGLVDSAGPWRLVDYGTGGATGVADSGCANRDVQVRSTYDADTWDETLYFMLQIPNQQDTGTYVGQNRFTFTDSGSCTGTAR